MSNPYAAPNAEISGDDIAYTTLFAINGRIGRVRWIGYLAVMWILTFAVTMVLAGLAQGKQDGAKWVGGFFLIGAFIVFLVVSRRRLQDLELGPLFLVLAIIPFINLYFLFMMLFKRGDEARNDYGPAPLPNNRAAYLFAAIIPGMIVLMLGIRVYDDFERARIRADPSTPAWRRDYGK